jgi:hypothetical protein
LALRRSAGILECWSVGKIVVEKFYFITPLLQYSERVRFNKRIAAKGDDVCSLA